MTEYHLTGSAHSLDDVRRDLAVLRGLEEQMMNAIHDQPIIYATLLSFAQQHDVKSGVAIRVWNSVGFQDGELTLRLVDKEIPLGLLAWQNDVQLKNVVNVGRQGRALLQAFLESKGSYVGAAKNWVPPDRPD